MVLTNSFCMMVVIKNGRSHGHIPKFSGGEQCRKQSSGRLAGVDVFLDKTRIEFKKRSLVLVLYMEVSW